MNGNENNTSSNASEDTMNDFEAMLAEAEASLANETPEERAAFEAEHNKAFTLANTEENLIAGHKKINRVASSQVEKREIPDGYKVCSRCDGTGQLTQYHYHQGGVCFKCGGAGFVPWA
jgi:DnaJ-class molecular chaperone